MIVVAVAVIVVVAVAAASDRYCEPRVRDCPSGYAGGGVMRQLPSDFRLSQ
jgi:hypothetical protein